MPSCFRSALLLGVSVLATAAQAHRAPHLAPAGLAAPDAAHGIAPTPKIYGGTPTDVLTYHYDSSRTGWNPTETDLTPASVASSNFVKLTTLAVDGNVLAQPLIVSRLTFPDASVHDVVIIATGHNTIYAYDTQTFAVLWSRNLGPSQSSNDVGCGDVVPEYGISSTPVIQRHSASAATMYVVSAQEPNPGEFHTYLHALDVATGNDVLTQQEIAPSATLKAGTAIGFDPRNQWSRAGLAATSGAIYVSIGSHCDNNQGSITGWELAFSPTTLAQTAAFHTIETPGGTELASIWMTGFAPAIDSTGNLFVVTGNGDFTKGRSDWGESALKLSPDLSKVLGKFTPAGYGNLNNNDADFGSGGRARFVNRIMLQHGGIVHLSFVGRFSRR